MNRIFAIIIISFTLFSCNSAESQQNSKVINFESGFSLIQDSISISVNGEMTHALQFQDKYYVLFEQRLMKYGGYGKRWLYIFSNIQLERVIDCPNKCKLFIWSFICKTTPLF